MSSAPPPPTPSPGPGAPAGPRSEIVLALGGRRRGLRGRLGTSRPATVRLRGTEITITHPAMTEALTLAGGVVAVATVDDGVAAGDGRFPILRRMGPAQVLPREHGIEGWLWTAAQGSGLPALADDDAPNLALVFAKPLDEATVVRHFRPDWVRALAERSPLGAPAVPGVLLTVESASRAEDAFRRFGVLGPLTDREVPPALRRHLPGDKPANPVVTGGDDRLSRTSFAPPGAR